MASTSHPFLDDYLRDLSARTGLMHVYGDKAFAQRQAPGKTIVWTAPTRGSNWINAEQAPAVHVPEGDIFCAVAETCMMHVWGTDEHSALAMLFLIWRLGFDAHVITRNDQSWRFAMSYGSVSRDVDVVPENGFALTDRVVVRYLLPRQGELYAEADNVPMTGVMQDESGNTIGAT